MHIDKRGRSKTLFYPVVSGILFFLGLDVNGLIYSGSPLENVNSEISCMIAS